MKGINQDIMFIPPQRSVSLYWVEKWLLIIDVVQIWCLLWIIVAPQLPQTWNSVTHPVLICNLDIFHLYFMSLDASNVLNTSKLGAEMVPRILLAALPVGLAVVGSLLLSLGNRWVSLAHSRTSAVKNTETTEDRLDNCRRSTARVSLSRMFAIDIEEKDDEQSAVKIFLLNMWDRVSILAVQSRLILVVWVFAPICNAVFPVVFCEDQAEICSETPLFLFRLVLGLVAAPLALVAIQRVGRHVSQHIVAHTDKHHEEYVQQKEIEYMLHINDSWRIQMLWMFTSFKREWRRVYHRQSLMVVKLTLCLIISLFGTDLFRTQFGLAWVFRLVFPTGFRESNSSSEQGHISLASTGRNPSPLDQLLENPLGSQMRTILGCTVVFAFAVYSFVRLPFRQRSSNALYVIAWLLLVCVSSVAFALACTASPIGVLLPANLVPLLKTIHLLTIAGFLVVYCVGTMRTLLPNSTSALVTAPANNLEELTDGQKDEDLRQRQKAMQKVKRRLLVRHGARMIHNAWFKVATNTRLARNSMSAIWSRGSSCALDEDGALYPSFLDSPWPISFYEGRYFIVSYPHVLRALKRARNVIDRYLFADKTLVPLTILDSAHADLQQHLLTFLSLREKHASLSKEDERQTMPNMAVSSVHGDHTELNAALSEAERQLALFDKELGDADEDSTDAEDEEGSDTLSEASVNSRVTADTASDADETRGAAHGRRGVLALTDGVKSPKSHRRGTGSAGGLLRDAAVDASTRGDTREQGTDVTMDCQRVEGILRKMRQGGTNTLVGVAFSSVECPEKGEFSAKQADTTTFSRQDDLLEALLKKASQVREADSRPIIWDPSTDDRWKELIEILDGEAADGARKAAEVARKSAELDFESLALGTWSMADSPAEKSGTRRNNAVSLAQRRREGERMYGGGRTVGAGLLKRQNGGPLDAIDDLLAEMEEEADDENIAETADVSGGPSSDGGCFLCVDFERPVLPNTAEILEAFKGKEDSRMVLDGTDEDEHGLTEVGAVERSCLGREEATGGTTVSLEQTMSPTEDKALERDGESGDGGHAVVESKLTNFNERRLEGQQENIQDVDAAGGSGQRRRRKKKLHDAASFSHLPESARRAALEFKVRRLSTLSHLSERFRDLPVRRLFNEMHHRQSLNHAFRWILLEAFETLSGLRSEVAPVTCLPTTLPNGGEALMAVLATRCRQRDQDLFLMNPKKRRILTKLLAIQFLCGTTPQTGKRTDAMIEKMFRDFSMILGE